MLNTSQRDHRPPRPRRAPVAPVASDDAFDNASGIFSTSGTISECTMASFLLESNNRTNNRTSRMESPRQQHLMSPNTAAVLRRKQEDARVAIVSLNRFIFQAGNLYRGKRLNRDEENILRESAHQVGLSLDIVDALLEHTSDSNAVVQYCMESEDSFARKIRKDRRLSQLLQQDTVEPEGNFNLKSSIWRILMHKIVQQTLREHGMDIGDVMNKSYTEASHNDEYAMNSAEGERYGRDYTEERKRLILPEHEIRDARRSAMAQMEFHQSRGPMDAFQNNRDDIPLMIAAGSTAECRDDEMSLSDAYGLQHEERLHSAQRQRSSPLTPKSLNVQRQRNDSHQRTAHPDSAYNTIVDPAQDHSDPDENDYHDMGNENRPPRSSGISPHAPLSAVKRALAMFESPGKFDQETPQKQNSISMKRRRGSSSKIADRLALFEKVQDDSDPIDYQQLQRVKSSEHQAIQATSLFDVFSTPQKQSINRKEPQRAASTSKLSKVKRSHIAAFENGGSASKPDANGRVARSDVKKLDPSRRILFDEGSKSSASIQEKGFSGDRDKHARNSRDLYQSGSQQSPYSQHLSDSHGEHIDDCSGPPESIDDLKYGWKNHSTPPTSSRRPQSQSVRFQGTPEPITNDNPKRHVTFGESKSAKQAQPQGSLNNPQKSAMDKMLKKARASPKPPTPSKQSQRSLKIREQLLKNMSMTSNDDYHQEISNQPVPSDSISVNSYHSMDESLDPASVRDYGPQREVKRTPRQKRNIREENFMDDERVRIEPPEQMFYFEAIEDIARNMMEEDSLMEHAMNANAHHGNVLVSETLSSSPGNSVSELHFHDQRMKTPQHFDTGSINPDDDGSYDSGEGSDQYEDDMSEEQPFVSDLPAAKEASDQIPIESMISTISSGELIQAPESYSTFTDDENRSWVEFHQVFDSIHGARSEISQVESDLNSSKKRMESMFDTLHHVKQEAISMERRKPEREAKEIEKPVQAYHPLTPGASKKALDNEFFEDVRLSGSKAKFQVTHNETENWEFALRDRERRSDAKSSTQLLDVPQTDPEEWAHFQNSHFHSDSSIQDQSALSHQEGVEEYISDVTDSRYTMGSHDKNETNRSMVNVTEPAAQVAYQTSGVNLATSSMTESCDESEADFMNPYGSKVAQTNGLSFTKAMKMAKDNARMGDPPLQGLEDTKPRTPRKSSSPRYPRSPADAYNKAKQESKMKTPKDRTFEQDKPQEGAGEKQPKSSPKYPRSPVFDKAMQKAKKHNVRDDNGNSEPEIPPAGVDQKQEKASPRHPESPAAAYDKAKQKARNHRDSNGNLKSDTPTARLEREQPKQQDSSPRYPRSPAFGKALQSRRAKESEKEPVSSQEVLLQQSFDYHDLPPPPSLEEAFNLDTQNVQDDEFHQAKTPRTRHGKAKSSTNQINSIQMKRSSSSLSRFLRIDTSRSDEEDVGLKGASANGKTNWDRPEDVRSAAQASGVPQQVIDIIMKQAAEHEKELVEAASEEDLRSWDAIAKKTKQKQRKSQVESPLALSNKTEVLYSLPKQKKNKPIKVDISLIPDEIPEGVSKEDVKLLERFIQLSTSNFEGKNLSADSEARVRAAANNVGLAEDIIDQLLEQARWKREQKVQPENDTLHQQQEGTTTTSNNNTYHQYHSDFSNTHVHFEDGYSTARHQFPSASPVRPTAYPESPGYTVPRDQRWSTRRRRSEEYRRNACNDPCRILGNIKDNLLYWANCQGGGSFDEDEYSITGSDL